MVQSMFEPKSCVTLVLLLLSGDFKRNMLIYGTFDTLPHMRTEGLLKIINSVDPVDDGDFQGWQVLSSYCMSRVRWHALWYYFNFNSLKWRMKKLFLVFCFLIWVKHWVEEVWDHNLKVAQLVGGGVQPCSGKTAGREPGGPHREQDQQRVPLNGKDEFRALHWPEGLTPGCSCFSLTWSSAKSSRFPLLKDLTLHLKEGHSAEIRGQRTAETDSPLCLCQIRRPSL